jgi:hypothetical protein
MSLMSYTCKNARSPPRTALTRLSLSSSHATRNQPLITPARLADHKKAPAGTAIVWNSNLAVCAHGGYGFLPHRSTCVGMHAGEFGHVAIASTYGSVNQKHDTIGADIEITEEATKAEAQMIVGGDFNLEAEVMATWMSRTRPAHRIALAGPSLKRVQTFLALVSKHGHTQFVLVSTKMSRPNRATTQFEI